MGPPVAVVGVRAKGKGYGKGYHKGKGAGKGVVVVGNSPASPPLAISSVSLPPSVFEMRGLNRFFGVDVSPQSGQAWRVFRSDDDFRGLYGNVGSPSLSYPFPRSLDEKMNAGADRRYDFGIGLGKCAQCGGRSYNRGDSASNKVYCLPCYNKLFPDAAALNDHRRELEVWLQELTQNPNSNGLWKEPLRGFLEAGRQFIASAPQAAVASAVPAPVAAAAAPLPAAAGAAASQAMYGRHDGAGSPPAAAPVVAPAPAPPTGDDAAGLMAIDIPAGVAAGQVLAITVLDGKQIEFTVPEGSQGGDHLELWYDPVAGTLTPIDASGGGSASDGGEVMVIDIPAGVTSGQVLAITVPDGRQIEFTVPDGKGGGAQLELWFDPAAGTLAPLS